MRILMLTQWFDPEPTIKGLAFARALVRNGHEVQVITGFPNYPGGKIYPGYRVRPATRELIDGIRITRVALYPSHDRSAVGRALNYASFAASSTMAGLLTRFKPDVMYVYHPPLTVGLAATVIGFFRRVPFVYDVQDLWPDTLAATGMIRNEMIVSLVGRLALWVYRRAALLIAQSPGFVTRLIDRGVPAGKVRLIHNWCDEEALAARAANHATDLGALAGRFNVVFAGNMGKAQALRALLDAAALVGARDRRVQFVFVGGGTEVDDLQRYAQSIELRNVIFLPRMSMGEVGHVLDAADTLLVHLKNSPLFAITLPSKIQAYLFAGKPVLMAVRGDAADMINEVGAGICAKPEDPAAIADAVVRMASLSPDERRALGERGKRFYEESLSLAIGTRRMVRAFEDAIAAHGADARPPR